MKTISFKSTKDENILVEKLRRKVNAYFSFYNIKKTGNFLLYFKTIIFVFSFCVLYYFLLFTNLTFFSGAIYSVLLGLSIAFVGFNVMHDGAHGSYSNKEWINSLMGFSLNLLGGNVYLWKFKHNILHHTYTNIADNDEDIETGELMRFSKDQPKKWFHRFQYLYWIVLYSQMYIIWVYYKDFLKYFTGKIGAKEFPKMEIKEHFIFWITKIMNVFLFIVFPLMQYSFFVWLPMFLIAMFVCGIIISVVFQLAHIVPKTTFPMPEKTSGMINQNWFLHQLATTADFARSSKFISFFLGGLNFQIEHHLFPKISHVHYPKISILIKDFCKKNSIEYFEYKTFFKAFFAHIKHLREMGVA